MTALRQRFGNQQSRHRLSAGVIVLRHGPVEWLFLMLRAYRNWDFPKGMVEVNEDPLAAARREVREETLIEDLAFEWGEVYRETAPYGNRKVARYYLATTRTEGVSLPVSPELGRPEHDEWRWVDRDTALSLASARLQPIVQWAVKTIGIA
ncbi:MAG: NUDIX domain-containing protein [Steroidobacterales bacterium]|jgi:8-oxo-dGTP pyrophosphatase MutT (NUDIX family)